MPVTVGPLYPSSADQEHPGMSSNPWSNIGNIVSDNGAHATSNVSKNNMTYYARGTNFGFAIPSNATILGIYAEFERGCNFNQFYDGGIFLMKNGSRVGSNKAVGVNWNSNTVYAYGGASDLWGTTWTPAEINASGFGFACAGHHQGGDDVRSVWIDFLRVTVTYEPLSQGMGMML